ncbi:hypothetical protein CHS0354_027001 [Potamilus streckersoni]|uniref:Btz domain-containing protein n=1 Tax=Potamilus streckersoni TaxID=2493646 RepID=A0AAE0VZL3_9BIVA|nr:hypothetical protein CHS0354_027001 [Potamilus streckersoni]
MPLPKDKPFRRREKRTPPFRRKRPLSSGRHRSRSYSPRHRSLQRKRSRSPRSHKYGRSRSPQTRTKSPRKHSWSPRRSSSVGPRRTSTTGPRLLRTGSPPRRHSRSPLRKQSPVSGHVDMIYKEGSLGQSLPDRTIRDAPGYLKSPGRERLSPFSSHDRRNSECDDGLGRSGYSKKRDSLSPGHRSGSPGFLKKNLLYSESRYAEQVTSKSLFPVLQHKEIPSVKIVDSRKIRISLDLRFRTAEQEKRGLFEIEENITVGIHRGPQHLALETSPLEVIRDFDPENFIMLRRADEGKKPIFDRDEIKIFQHDDNLEEEAYTEKRTITVTPTEKHRRGEYQITVPSSEDNGRDREDRRKVLSCHDHSTRNDRLRHFPDRYEEPRFERKVMSPDREPQVRLDPRPDPRYEPLFRERQKEEQKEQKRLEKLKQNPHDLRHNLMRRKVETSAMIDARKRIEARRRTEKELVLSEDRGQSSDRKRWDRSRDKEHQLERKKSIDNKEGKSRHHEDTNLPDFKKRSDKYCYEEWKDKPEMIPKGPSYYEHDNRDDYFSRGRGLGFRRPFRGGFRGRIRGQGFYPRGSSFRSRGFSSSSSYSRERERPLKPTQGTREASSEEWKHDLFDQTEKAEPEKDKDKEPSSTT